jgi:hypothetical protein
MRGRTIEGRVFASMTGTFTNQPSQFRRHTFAHAFLASVSRTYLGFHHAHQKLGLLVTSFRLIELVGGKVGGNCRTRRHRWSYRSDVARRSTDSKKFPPLVPIPHRKKPIKRSSGNERLELQHAVDGTLKFRYQRSKVALSSSGKLRWGQVLCSVFMSGDASI